MSITRRNFVWAGAALMGSAVTGVAAQIPGAAGTAPGGAPLLDAIGMQLYMVRSTMRRDLAGTIEKVAALGYSEVEFAGYFRHSPDEIRQILDDNGLISPSAHISQQLLQVDIDNALKAAQTIGHRFLVLPWISRADYPTLREYEKLAEQMNTFAGSCRDAGLGFAYHNHDFEFAAQGGKLPYDVLLENTDPELVSMELDVFWAVNAGVDPANYLQQHAGRFPLLHLKDRTATGEMVDVGSGVIDFASLLLLAKEQGTRHFYVEHDKPRDAMATAQNSIAVLQALRSP